MPHHLQNLFNPQSIAVIGASDKPNSVGMRVFNNLLESEYAGLLYAINPKHTKLLGQPCYPSVGAFKKTIDLAVITTPANTVLEILNECGKAGVKAAIIISAGFSEIGARGKELEKALLDVAHRYHLRLIGPNCLGVMRPHIHMNATFDNNFALPGGIALVSQSGALCAGILDWALDKQIGFSALISLGNSMDVDFGDVLDYLAVDPKTQSILLYIEGVHQTHSFIRGLRHAASKKPVIAIKAGRHNLGSRAALSHTGALIGDDDVFDAVLQRVGAVRVFTVEEFFTAAQLLASNYRVKNNRLVIITNGGGAGVMAADRVSEVDVVLPELAKDTLQRLNKVLPSNWSHQNPVDIIGDAPPKRYHDAINICLQDENVDGLLALLVPVAMANPLKVAEQIIENAKQSKKPILTSWLGGKHVKNSRELFAEHHIPTFSTPEKAVTAFSYLVRYQKNQALLKQTTEKWTAQHMKSDVKKARAIIDNALKEGRELLSATESKALLATFAIPVVKTSEVSSESEAVAAAKKIKYPLVMKINSPDISHKSDAGGVIVNITDEKMLRDAYQKIIKNAKSFKKNANILGVTIEQMVKGENDRELMIGIISDKVFGPVITFGAGGILVELMHDRALALPPINRLLAEDLINRTRIAKMLGKFRHMPPVNIDQIIRVLLQVSYLITEIPQIQEMDINPLIINEHNIIAVDARIVITETNPKMPPYSHLAIMSDTKTN